MKRKVEFIESYIKVGNDYQWNDNHGELIRCKDCKHRPHKNKDGYVMPPRIQVGVYAWGEPEYDDDETCPYVCEDRWYNSVPDDEQYCDRAEPKEDK